MSKKPRIPLAGPREALQSPFAALDLPDLPPGVTEEEPKATAAAPGRVVLRKEKAHRGGKSVIVVSGFHDGISADEIADYAKEARRQLGCGGTVREREAEFQGDHPEAVRRFFESRGFRVAGI